MSGDYSDNEPNRSSFSSFTGVEGSVEHALLESLFYKEMMLMDSSNHSTNTNSSNSGDGGGFGIDGEGSVGSELMAFLTTQDETIKNNGTITTRRFDDDEDDDLDDYNYDYHASEEDAQSIIEKAMLRDFGVMEGLSQPFATHHQQPASSVPVPMDTSMDHHQFSKPSTAAQTLPQQVPPPVGTDAVSSSSSAAAAAVPPPTPASLKAPVSAKNLSARLGFPQFTAISSAMKPSALTTAIHPSNPPAVTMTPTTTAAAMVPPISVPSIPPRPSPTPPSANNNNNSSSSSMRRLSSSSFTSAAMMPTEMGQKLVSQFTSLAGRLGISLPSNILATLTTKAKAPLSALMGSTANTTLTTATSATSSNHNNTSIGSGVPSTNNTTAPVPTSASVAAGAPVKRVPPPAAFSLHDKSKKNCKKRRSPSPTPTPEPSSPSRSTLSPANTKAPLYSKRRKKPRLQDCESKLASLQGENETLKRHLAIVKDGKQKLEEERVRQEREMRALVKEGGVDGGSAGNEATVEAKLQPLVEKFSEVYSDYGRSRHQELTFHLDQLQRLVVPTNFTKMGLWTLGQHEKFYTDLKRNPIAGILREELEITPQQGRKILEQREKMRILTQNLKECLGLLQKLKELCEHKQAIFKGRMSKCQEILTPLQVVKLLVWVDEHTDVLESVCPGWGSERMTQTTTSTTNNNNNNNGGSGESKAAATAGMSTTTNKNNGEPEQQSHQHSASECAGVV